MSITDTMNLSARKSFTELGNNLNRPLRELLNYGLRFINRYKNPKCQILEDYKKESKERIALKRKV